MAIQTVNPIAPGANHKAEQPSAVKAAIDAAKDAANTDSLALHQLTNIVKLVAFACEARRVLKGTFDLLPYYPEADKHVAASVTACRSWIEFDDVTGDVLQDVAIRLDKLDEVISHRPYELDKSFSPLA
jgi:hypothetical protein